MSLNELEVEGLKVKIKELINEVLDEREFAKEESETETEDESWEEPGETEDEEAASPEEVAEDIPSGSQVDKEKMDELNLKQKKENEKNLKKANEKAKEKVQKFRDQDKGFDDNPDVDEETSDDDLSEYEEQN